MPIPHDRCIDLAVAEVRRMAAVCRGADPATPVPTCPEWDLAELVRHTGMVHRWAATMVERGSQERLDRRGLDFGIPEDPTGLADWLDAGAAVVEAAFRGCDPDAAMWAWGWPKLARFWPRRMIHETAVHRSDAEIALALAPTIDPEAAADGLDELLDNLPHAAYFAPTVENLRGDGEVLALVATDLATSWRIELEPDGFRWAREEAPGATATLALPAGELFLTTYRRRPLDPTAVSGDPAVVDRWLSGTAL